MENCFKLLISLLFRGRQIPFLYHPVCATSIFFVNTYLFPNVYMRLTDKTFFASETLYQLYIYKVLTLTLYIIINN